jgi:hypothetical protein
MQREPYSLRPGMALVKMIEDLADDSREIIDRLQVSYPVSLNHDQDSILIWLHNIITTVKRGKWSGKG